MEYAYFDGFFKGNSKEMVESLAKLKKFFDANVLMEFAYTSNNISVFATKEPVLLIVKVSGDIGEARFQALSLLKNLGFVRKETINFEDAFRLAEKIEKMSVENLLRELRKLKFDK